MEKSLSIKPNQSMSLSLEDVAHLKNPRLFISLDSDDQPNLLRSSVSSTSIHSLEYDNNQQHHHCKHYQHQQSCTSCDALKRMLYLRDRTIMKLAEDRDMIKIKLTKAMNMNIELSRQLMRHQKVNQPTTTTSGASPSSPPPQPMNPLTSSSPLVRSKSPINTQIRDEVADLRRKCAQLDDIYQHLKHHLFALRSVFADLGANNSCCLDDSGSGYHLEEDIEEEDLSSINSSLSRASLPQLKVQNGIYHNKSSSKGQVAEDEEQDGGESVDTDFHPLPPTRSALKTTGRHLRGKAVDSNNNSGNTQLQLQLGQQQSSPPNSLEATQNKQNNEAVKSSSSIVVEIDRVEEKPQLSNFDIWYNS